MKLRTAKDKLKIEHRIIPGVQRFLETMIGVQPKIRLVVPGRIRKVRDARGPVKARVTVPVNNGWKALAFSAGERQELFISTTLDKKELEALIDSTLTELK